MRWRWPVLRDGMVEGNMTTKKPAAEPLVELSFSLVVGNDPPRPFKLTGTSSSIRIGRNGDADLPLMVSSVSFEHCELMLRRKNRDPLLYVKDSSRNKTAVRHPSMEVPEPVWKEINNNDAEQLHHRSELLVPARQKKAKGAPDTRVRITVLFMLPDAWCPWSKTGRWEYIERLGEGGLAVVYRARDTQNNRRWVAIKVSKFSNAPPASSQNRHIYALHREARWSLERLHNSTSKHHEIGGAVLFAKYLEDHTGFAAHAPGSDFDALRRRFEDPAFQWAAHSFDPPLSPAPYVVMEFIDGKLLQHIVEHGPPLGTDEALAVARQCCKALVYMERFGVLHRDFRGCNIFLLGRGPRCLVKVIDLGFMISADDWQEKNPNPAVRCAWQGDPEKKIKFDWAPPEVRSRGAPNFGLPPYSFDVFSFGVLLLKLLHGRSWASDVLQHNTVAPQLNAVKRDVEALGLSVDVLIRMLDQVNPSKRPLASDVLQVMNKKRLRTA